MIPSKINDIMNMARRSRQHGDIFNPLFVGPPGLGKTEIIQQWAIENNLPFIVMTLSTYDAPDFRGYPHITVTKEGRQRLSFASPDFWPDGGEGVIILEELNRSNPSIMNCLMSLTDKRRGFDGYKLPDGWMVAGCINPEDSQYETQTMDVALKDRFEMFNVEYDRNVFLTFMKGAGWHKDITLFVESGVWNYVAPERIKDAPGAKYVSPRTLSKLNAALKAGFDKDDEILIYHTILGANVGKDFYNFLHNESPVFYYDIIHNFKESMEKLRKFSDPANFKNGLISLTIKDVVENGEAIEDKLLIEILKVLPVEKGITLVRDLEFKRNDPTLLKRLLKVSPEIKEQFKAVVNYVGKSTK